MTKKCCDVHFITFDTDNNYTKLECFIMNMLSVSEIKNPKNNVRKVLKNEAKVVYDCCRFADRLKHSFGELHEHVKYVNRNNIADAKEVWARKNKKEKNKK